MATMGRYCKAYPLKSLREFSGWVEKRENARREKKAVDGEEVELPRELTDSDYLYVQETYVVTDGIFLDEQIIFDQVTPEWIEYCRSELQFIIPDFARSSPAVS
jgi:hypothetical protein